MAHEPLGHRHTSKHAKVSSHPVTASAEPNERRLYCYVDDETVEYRTTVTT